MGCAFKWVFGGGGRGGGKGVQMYFIELLLVIQQTVFFSGKNALKTKLIKIPTKRYFNFGLRPILREILRVEVVRNRRS